MAGWDGFAGLELRSGGWPNRASSRSTWRPIRGGRFVSSRAASSSGSFWPALAQDAQIYFMDEPFAGVDAATEQAIVVLLQALHRVERPCSSSITNCRACGTISTT